MHVWVASLVAQLVKNLPAMQETWFDWWVWKIHWRRDRLFTPVFLGFPGGSVEKNLPAVLEAWVWSLGWGDSLEGMATDYSILAWRIPCIVPGVTKSWTGLSHFCFHFSLPHVSVHTYSISCVSLENTNTNTILCLPEIWNQFDVLYFYLLTLATLITRYRKLSRLKKHPTSPS